MGRKRKKTYKVLVICGGGIFGYIPARFLGNSRVDKRGYQLSDAFGGTSIGGILTLMLNYGYKPKQVMDSFVNLANKAFHRSFWSSLNPWGAKFDGTGIEEALLGLFGDSVMAELKKPIIVPTIDFEHNKPKIYDNIIKDKDFDVKIRDLARMTSAAPTYFPPKDGHIDGGLLANNPVIETVTAIKAKQNIPYDCMEVLVLGTGKFPAIKRDMEDVAGWSAIGWLKPMLNYLTKANEMKADFVGKQIGLRSYTLFNPVEIDPGWNMDDPELITQLEELAKPWQSKFDVVFKEFLAN